MSIQPRLSAPDRAGTAVVESTARATRPDPGKPFLPGADDRLVVCGTGPDEAGVPSVALWWTDLSGEPKAGWLFPEELAEQDPRVAGRLLVAAGYGRPAQRRAGTGWSLLARLAERAGQTSTVTGPLDVDDLVARVRRRIGPVPALHPTPAPHRCPVVADLLATCSLIGWATRVWAGAADTQVSGPSPVSQWLRQESVAGNLS